MKEEIERWQMLSYQYMTEESDAADEPNVIIFHKLEWRSQKLICIWDLTLLVPSLQLSSTYTHWIIDLKHCLQGKVHLMLQRKFVEKEYLHCRCHQSTHLPGLFVRLHQMVKVHVYRVPLSVSAHTHACVYTHTARYSIDACLYVI